jgi:hypothetical protein
MLCGILLIPSECSNDFSLSDLCIEIPANVENNTPILEN